MIQGGRFKSAARPATSAMIVDDAGIFEPPPAPPPPPRPYTNYTPANTSLKDSIELVNQMANETVRELQEKVPIDDVLGLLDRDGHRRRAGLLTPAEGTREYWAQHPMPGEPIGKHTAGYSGVPLSPPCRDRMLQSIEHDAPALVLNELRMLARKDTQTGVSAWRTIRERERALGK